MRALSLERTADWALSTEALTFAPALFVMRATFTLHALVALWCSESITESSPTYPMEYDNWATSSITPTWKRIASVTREPDENGDVSGGLCKLTDSIPYCTLAH
jgi:hypothetical protein